MFKPKDLVLVVFSHLLCTYLVICQADDYSLQDICPTAPSTNQPGRLFINGFPCKDPAKITASDFKSMALTNAGETDNILGSFTSIVSASEYPGLNTLGLSIGRTDLEVGGLVSAHAHPRSSEMFFVVKGEIVAGFFDSHNKVFEKVVKGGDVFVVPRGLLHFIFNDGRESATMFSVFNSQNPGLVDISGALFQSDPSAAKMMTTKILAFVTKTAGKVHTREGHRVSLSQTREADLQLDI